MQVMQSILLFERTRLLQQFALVDHDVAFDFTIAEACAELFDHAVRLDRSALASPLDQNILPHVLRTGLHALVDWFGGEAQLHTGMGITPEQCAILGHFLLDEEDNVLQCHKGVVATADAMAVVWLHLHNRTTLCESQNVQGNDESKMSAMLNKATFCISGFFACLEHLAWLTGERRSLYAAAISFNRCPVPLVNGFINGVLFDIAHPKENQVAHVLGCTKTHKLVFLAIVFPDGTLWVRGPVEGCRGMTLVQCVLLAGMKKQA